MFGWFVFAAGCVAVFFEGVFEEGDEFEGDVLVEFFVFIGGGWCWGGEGVLDDVDGSDVSCCSEEVFAVLGYFGCACGEGAYLIGEAC